jgi:sterol 3beta-glucosyltransferase
MIDFMNLLLLTFGSRGDVQPFVALGRGLRAAGHAVTLATHAPFAGLASEHGLGFWPMSADPQALMETEDVQRWLESGNNPVRFVKRMLDLMGPYVTQVVRETEAAMAGAEGIIASPLGLPAAALVSERSGQRLVLAAMQPVLPSRELASVFAPVWPLGPFYNLATHGAIDLAGRWLALPLARRARRELYGVDRPAHGGFWRQLLTHTRLHLVAVSEQVVPRPRDWPGQARMTGYWTTPVAEGYQPPEHLARFLEAGPAPVYIGFGSLFGREPERVTEVVIAAVRRAGLRAVLLRGWGGLRPPDATPDLCVVDSVPHEWLFPRMAVIVHHGGAGTTAAALRSGRPSFAVPIFADQPFWGARCHHLGVGPSPLPAGRLTVIGLAERLTLASRSGAMRRRARDLGQRLQAEDGVANAVEQIGRLA